MKPSPLVSILIPLYNAEEYIAVTLENCLAQSYENIEIIVVDDGSSDGGLKIAREYEKKYGNIHVYEQPNSGAPRARNLAFAKSRGEYIQYLDADDLMSENKIATQMKLMEKHGQRAVCSCRFEHFLKEPGDMGYVWRAVDRSFDSGLEWLIEAWSGAWMGVVMSWLTPRGLIEKAGLWNESLKKNQDGEFFARVLLKAEKVIFAEDCVVYYRITGNTSVASQYSQQAAASVLETLKLYEAHTQTLQHPRLQGALASNYFQFIRSYYPHYSQLLKEAEASIKRLGFNYRTLPVQGKLRLPAKIVGADNLVKMQYLVRKLLGKTKS